MPRTIGVGWSLLWKTLASWGVFFAVFWIVDLLFPSAKALPWFVDLPLWFHSAMLVALLEIFAVREILSLETKLAAAEAPPLEIRFEEAPPFLTQRNIAPDGEPFYEWVLYIEIKNAGKRFQEARLIQVSFQPEESEATDGLAFCPRGGSDDQGFVKLAPDQPVLVHIASYRHYGTDSPIRLYYRQLDDYISVPASPHLLGVKLYGGIEPQPLTLRLSADHNGLVATRVQDTSSANAQALGVIPAAWAGVVRRLPWTRTKL